MRKISFVFALILISCMTYAQPAAYTEWINKAKSWYDAGQNERAAAAFTQAFATMGGRAYQMDRYNAACVWALTGEKDSAFYHLNILATKNKFKDEQILMNDKDLAGLRDDDRWANIMEQVKKNKVQATAHLDKKLVAMLDALMRDDQGGRMQTDSVSKQYGPNSKRVSDLWNKIGAQDSANMVKVAAILQKYGWPTAEVAGDAGSETIFLVIQHADLASQDKYLPMVRDAVKDKKLSPGSLAILEDRTALRHGKKQIYGSQIGIDPKGKYLSPLMDPDNVDKRRAEVGLEPLSDYLQNFQMTWNMAEYKKQLPELEQRERKRMGN